MPFLLDPVRPAGSMSQLTQPVIDVDGVDLRLRPWRRTDADAVIAAFDDPDIQRWHTRRMDSVEEAHEWIDSWPERWHAETDAGWAIADAQSDEALGQIGLRTIRLGIGEAQISYWMRPDSRGRGYATAACRALSDWTFSALQMHRLVILHSTRNASSCVVTEKAGYPLEATLRDYLLHQDGWHDTHVHTRLAE